MRNWFVDNLYMRGEFSYSNDRTGYRGSFTGLPSDYGTVKQTHHAETIDFDFRIGKGFSFGPNVMVTPFIGAGSHYWDRDSSKSEGGSREEYSHGYAGGGLLVQFVPFDRFVVSTNGFVGSTFESFLNVTKTPVGQIPFSVNLGNSLIYKLGIGGDYALTDHLHLTAGFDYTHFEYREGVNFAANAKEPDSRTSDMRFKVGLGYSF